MNPDKKMNRTAALLILLLLFAGVAVVAPAAALKVTGARIALDVTPGQATTAPIGISIGTDEAEGDFAVDVLGFGQSVVDGTYTGLEASADTGQYSARPFITVDKPTVHLKPGGSAAVTANIAVPANAKDGGRYAIILVHPATSSFGAPAAFATAVAIPVFLTIKEGTITETGEVVSVDAGKVDPNTPVTVTTTVRNTGNYHYYGVVNNVTFTNEQGKAVATVRTEPSVRAIVPGQQVRIKAAFASGVPDGAYVLSSRMEDQDGNLLAEKETAIMVGQAAAAAAPSAAPTKAPGPGVIAVCLAAVLGLRGGIKMTRKRIKRP